MRLILINMNVMCRLQNKHYICIRNRINVNKMSDFKCYLYNVRSGVTKDLEKDFPKAHYLKADGVNAVGDIRVYSEEYADEDGADVYIPEEVTHKGTEFTLSLLFFDGVNNDYSSVQACYESLLDFVSGSQIVFYDNVRRRKLLLHLESATKPTEDVIKGVVYIKAEFKFKNDRGRSYALGDDKLQPVITL